MSGSAGTTAMLCRRVREHDDQAAFAELVRRNRVAIRLVVREYRWAIGRGYLDRDEATQEVLLAFWEAAGRFEHNWQATFTTFAKVYARTRLKNAVRTQRQRKYEEQRDALHSGRAAEPGGPRHHARAISSRRRTTGSRRSSPKSGRTCAS